MFSPNNLKLILDKINEVKNDDSYGSFIINYEFKNILNKILNLKSDDFKKSPIYKLIDNNDLFDMIVKQYFTDKMMCNMKQISKNINSKIGLINYTFKSTYELSKVLNKIELNKIRKIICYNSDIKLLSNLKMMFAIDCLEITSFNINRKLCSELLPKFVRNLVVRGIRIIQNDINYELTNLEYLYTDKGSNLLLPIFKNITRLRTEEHIECDLYAYNKLKYLYIESDRFLEKQVILPCSLENIIIDHLCKYDLSCCKYSDYLCIKKLTLIICKNIISEIKLKNKYELHVKIIYLLDRTNQTTIYHLPKNLEKLKIIICDPKSVGGGNPNRFLFNGFKYRTIHNTYSINMKDVKTDSNQFIYF